MDDAPRMYGWLMSTHPEFLRDLAERLRHVPVMYGTDDGDIDRLLVIAREVEGDEPIPQYGMEEGDTCKRGGCGGIITIEPVEGCACLIAPPCWACTTSQLWCPTCHEVVE